MVAFLLVVDPHTVVTGFGLVGETLVLQRVADHLSGVFGGLVIALVVLQAVFEVDPVIDVIVAAVVQDHGLHGVGALRARPDRLGAAVALEARLEPG
ncbi:hypothetical protein CWO91_05560 [Bradyrhizobium genosp. SA-3]|nr:hypothetical protein CWO91_05560 [Bradyrhizobium genosp. SA-3]